MPHANGFVHRNLRLLSGFGRLAAEKQRKRLAQMSPNALQAQYKGLLRRIRTSLLGPLGPLSRAFIDDGIREPEDMALLVLLEYHAYRLDLLEAEQRRETDSGM